MPNVTTPPHGEYPHPAATHEIELTHEAERLIAELGGEGRRSRALARESGVSLVLMALAAGNVITEHVAPGVIIVQGIRGHVTVSAAGHEFDLGPGDAVMMQPAVQHALRAREEAVVLLTVTGGDV